MKALIALTSIVGFLMVVLPGPLYQYAGVSLGTAFTSLRFGVYVGGAAIILIILQVLLNRKNVNWGSTLVCAILALIAVGMPVSMMSKASAVPPIHDITTDLNDPPQFSTLDVEPVSTGPFTQEEWRAYHEESYADIEPVIIDKPPLEVLANARAVAEARGWKIENADPEAGILEATATAGYVRFYDDVVVEVTPVADGSTRVDMRSVSRVGVSDVGYNAARIRSFLADLRVAE